MDSGRRSLYIVTPDANAAIMRRLRGLGVSMGVPITPVSSASDLPKKSQDDAFLIIPEQFMGPHSLLRDWSNTFVICTGPKDPRSSNFNTIHVQRGMDGQIDWCYIATYMVKNVILKSNFGAWFSIEHKVVSKHSIPSKEFTIWARSFTALSTQKIERISNSLRTLERLISATNKTSFNLRITLESRSLGLALALDDTPSVDLENIIHIFDGLEFCHEATFSLHGQPTIKAHFYLDSTSSNRLLARIIHPLGASSTTAKSREAS